MSDEQGTGPGDESSALPRGWKDALGESIRQWEARPRYAELTPAILAGVPDDLLEQTVLDFVHNFRARPHEGLIALLRRLPPGFATVYTTWWLDAEIANGGLHQYFWNTEGAYVELVREGLQRLGAADHLGAFEEAVLVATHATRPAVDGLPARAQLEAFSQSALTGTFDALDARWDGLPDLAPARVRFIRANPTLLTARLPLRARLRVALGTRFRPRP